MIERPDIAVQEYRRQAGRHIPRELLSFEPPKHDAQHNSAEAGEQILPIKPRITVKVFVTEEPLAQRDNAPKPQLTTPIP